MSIAEVAEQTSAVEKLGPAVKGWVERQASHAVVDQRTYELNAELIVNLAQLEKAVDTTFDPILRAQREALRVTSEQRDFHRNPVREAIASAKRRGSNWAVAEENRRRQEQAEEQARQQRLEEDRRLAEAAALEAAGETREAEAVLEEPSFVPPSPSRADVAPAAAGVVLKDNWKAEIVDPAAIVKAVAAGLYPMAAIEINERYFNQQARSLKAEMTGERWPGVRAWNDRGMARTGR